MSQALGIAGTNLGAIIRTLGSKLIPGTGAAAQSLVGAALVGLALLGSRRAFADAPALAIFPWLYLAIVAAWSFPPFRFVFALFPLLLALAAVSVRALVRRLEPDEAALGVSRALRARDWLAVALQVVAVLVLAHLAYREARSVVRRVWEPGQERVARVGREVIDWVDDHTPSDAVVAFEFDSMLGFHTGRRAVPNSYTPVHPWYRRAPAPVDSLARLLATMGVHVVAVRPDIPEAARPIDRLMAAYPDVLETVHITGTGAMIFRVHPDRLPPVGGGVAGRTVRTAGAGAPALGLPGMDTLGLPGMERRSAR